MKTTITSSLLFAAALATSQGAVTLFAGYHLGESGSLGANNRPQDYSGNGRNITNEISGSSATVGSPGAYAGSSNFLDTSAASNVGWYGPNLSGVLATDNFGFSIWAKASANTAANQGDVFTLGGANGAFKLSLATNGWASSSHNVSWIGPSGGVTGSFAADTWTHLMLIRYNGVTTFYINDVAQSGTYAGGPTMGDIHLSVDPGGATYFDGGLDEARIVTFAGTDSLSSVRAALIPEPGAALLGGLGLLGLLRRRR